MKLSTLKQKATKFVLNNRSVALMLVFGLVTTLSLSGTVASAAQTTGEGCDTSSVTFQNGVKCAQPKGVSDSLTGQGGVFQIVANILLFLVGAIAVIMLIIGGLRYVTSNGDQNAVTGAKNTIMYAIIGIVVAFLAYAAVGFVVAQLGSGAAS